MEWAKSISKAIEYIEDNITTDISVEDIAKLREKNSIKHRHSVKYSCVCLCFSFEILSAKVNFCG